MRVGPSGAQMLVHSDHISQPFENGRYHLYARGTSLNPDHDNRLKNGFSRLPVLSIILYNAQ